MAGGESHGSACGSIEVEARVDAERRSVVEEAASRSFGFGEYPVGLLQCQRRESDGEQITCFGSKLANIFERVGILRIDDRQVICLRRSVEGFVRRRVAEAADVFACANCNRVAAGCLQGCGHVDARCPHGGLKILDRGSALKRLAEVSRIVGE